MKKPVNHFAKLTRRNSDFHDKMVARSNIAFEEGKVNYLLKMFGLNQRKVGSTLRKIEEARSGQADLTLRAFNEGFPTFPMLLGGSRLGSTALHLDPRAMLPALFKEFSQAPFLTYYEDFYEENADRANGRTLGLVFPRKGIRSGLVIYTADSVDEIPLGKREAFLAYCSGKRKDRYWLIVRTFQKVIEAIHNAGHGWRPGD